MASHAIVSRAEAYYLHVEAFLPFSSVPPRGLQIWTSLLLTPLHLQSQHSPHPHFKGRTLPAHRHALTAHASLQSHRYPQSLPLLGAEHVAL